MFEKRDSNGTSREAQPVKILYMEDDPGIARLVRKKLQRAGYDVDIAGNGEEGLRMYHEGSYTLLVLDYKMPVYGGLEIIRMLTSSGPLPPTIMISGSGDERIAVEAIKLGASDYVIKDVDGGFLELLPSVIKKVLQQQRIALEQKIAEKELRVAARVFEHTREGIMVTDENAIIRSVNPAFTEITGYSAEEVIDKNACMLRSGRQGKEFYEEMWSVLLKNHYWQGEIWNRRKNGESYPEWLSITAIKDAQGKVVQYAAVFSDITERKIFEKKLDYLANHDPLTGLPNRTLFNDRLNMGLIQAKRDEQQVAVMYIDMDHFKGINDSMGHAIGDRVLQTAAERFKTCLRKGDTVARQGGDEFTAILTNISKNRDITVVAQKILDSLSREFVVEEHSFFVTVSIGIALYPSDGEDSALLIKNADIALYRAKSMGRNNFQLYSPVMNKEATHQMALASNLRHALERKEFQVYYQPFFDLASEKLIGFKALLRWQHPELGPVPPNEFIPIAEEIGIIIPLGEWALRIACAQNKIWEDQGFPPLTLVVLFSRRQFSHKEMLHTLERVIKDVGIHPDCLELEITEKTAMHDPKLTTQRMTTLKKIGVKLRVSDIGTGDSWLANLKNFPIDTLKIDRSFLHDLTATSDQKELPNTIIGIAQTLKLKVIAEGVETRDQLEFLRSKHCDEILGHFFSHPMTSHEFTRLLREQK